MKKNAITFLLYLTPFLGIAQGVKTNLYDKFLKKQRVETESVSMLGIGQKNKLALGYTALGSTLYLNMNGAGWGASTVDNGDDLILLFSNDSVVTLKSASLQSFEPGLVQNTYRHQYLVTAKDLEALSKFDLASVRKYSFKTFSDIRIPKENSERIKKVSNLFVDELKKANVFNAVRPISVRDIRNFIGDSVEFCSRVYKTRYFHDSKDAPTLLDVQADFSDPFINVVILGKDRAKFNDAPEKRYLNKDVCISGVVTLRDNIPYVVIHDKEQVKLKSPITLNEIDLFVGDSVTVSGQVYTARFLEESKTKPTLLNMGAPFPDQPLTLVINFEDRQNFVRPEDEYLNKTLLVTGTVTSFKGKPQLVLRDRQQVLAISEPEPLKAVVLTELQTSTTVKHTAQNAAKQPTKESRQPSADAPLQYAEFPGGSEAFGQFLRDNLLYPEPMKAHEQKRVVASFEVDNDGDCHNIRIVESAGALYDSEVKRVLEKMPRWKPANKGGVNLPIVVTLPVSFKGADYEKQRKP